MRRLETVDLQDVKESLRRGGSGHVENFGGWCVFVDAKKVHRYVMDEHGKPVPYQVISPLRDIRSTPLSPTLHS